MLEFSSEFLRCLVKLRRIAAPAPPSRRDPACISGVWVLGLPRLTEISVTRGSELTVRFWFVFSRFRVGSGLCFLTTNAVKTDILTGKSYKI